MSSTFSLGGDPSSIRASAQQWNTFGEAAGTASSDIKGLGSEEFEGDEADDFRGKVNDNLPPNLDRTAEAWKQIGAALKVYADKLEDHQQKLSGLKTQHGNQQQTVQNAESSVTAAQTADSTEQNRATAASSLLQPGETLPPSTYHSSTGGAQSNLTEARSGLQDTIDAANKVQSDHRDAVRACCNDIENAKGKRFEKPPGFWDKLKNTVVDWVADHADVLKKISGVLKVISAIAGVLSFIPILAPITGPIALAAGGLALGIDVAVKLATGEGSWLEIGVDAALMVLPGAGKLLKPAIMGTKAGKVVNAVGVKGINALSRTKVGATASKVANSKVASLPGRGLNRVNGAVERGLRKVPGLNKLPAERVLTIKYKKGWTPAQRAALDQKAAQLNRLGERGQLLKTRPPVREPKLRERYAESRGLTKNQLPKDEQVDHIHELQLGGADELPNTQMLNGSVNSSSGSQIRPQIRGDADGTPYDRVVTAERP